MCRDIMRFSLDKFIAVGDPHAKLAHLAEIQILGEKIVAVMKKTGISDVVIFGDLANDFAKMHLQVFNAIIEFFQTIIDAPGRVFYVVGNHDAINNQIFLENDHRIEDLQEMGKL